MGRKILNIRQVQWDGEESSLLSYKKNFDKQEESASVEKEGEEIDVEKRIQEEKEKWMELLDQARRAAYQKGFESGLEEGRQAAAEQFEDKLKKIEGVFQEAHKEWLRRQKLMEPGLLELAFDVAESILGVPAENPKLREELNNEIEQLLQHAREDSRVVLEVSEADIEDVKKILKRYEEQHPVKVQVCEECKPGEFRLETDNETVLRDFRLMLADFKKSLKLPKW